MRWPWRRQQISNAPVVKVDAGIRRAVFYEEFDQHPGPCPQCGGELRQASVPYMVATHHGGQMADPFLIASDFGWFCDACPTVVINPDGVREILAHGRPDWDTGEEFIVVGIVDLDAIPPGQRRRPIDEVEPLPLVQSPSAPESAACR